jgi:hypothetical protein
MSLQETALVSASLAAAFLVTRYFTTKRAEHHLPPGPKKLPVLGNLLDVPTSLDWEVYQRYGKEAGAHFKPFLIKDLR